MVGVCLSARGVAVALAALAGILRVLLLQVLTDFCPDDRSIESNTLSGHGVYYGGHHAVHPQTLIKLGPQPLMIDNMPTPDKPKF